MMTGRWLFLTVATLIFVPITAEGQARVEKNVLVGMHSGLALVMDVHHSENPNGYGIVHISGSGWRRPLAYSAPPLEREAGRPLRPAARGAGLHGVFAEPSCDSAFSVSRSLGGRAACRALRPVSRCGIRNRSRPDWRCWRLVRRTLGQHARSVGRSRRLGRSRPGESGQCKSPNGRGPGSAGRSRTDRDYERKRRNCALAGSTAVPRPPGGRGRPVQGGITGQLHVHGRSPDPLAAW